MKRKYTSLVSLLLSVALALPLTVTGAAASDALITSAAPTATTAAAVDPLTIDRVIVNMRDADSFGDLMNIYVHTPTEVEPDPLTGGAIDFSAEKKAMQLVYAANARQPDYRAMVRFNQKNTITEEHKYAVFVYSAKSAKPYTMTLWNSPGVGPETIISKGDSVDTNGFIVTEPIDISVTNAKGSLLTRWMSSMNTIGFETEDDKAEVYIREIGFFKSAEDAKAYYGAVDIEKDPPAIDEEAVNEANLPAPVGIKFDKTVLMMGNGLGYFTKDGEITSANYTAVDLDGTTAVKLNYTPLGKWSPYVMMPRFSVPNTVTEQHKYVRIVYMTTDTAAHEITLYSNSGGGQVTLVNNTAESRGQWIVSDPVDISGAGNILQRYIEAKHNTIQFMSDSPDSEIYIKELMFFCSLKQAGDYYGDVVSTKQELTFGDGGNSGFLTGDNYGVFDINDIESTVDIKYAESTNMGTNYCAKIKFTDAELNTDYKYLRVLYRATIPNGQKNIQMALRNDGGSDRSTLSTTVEDTNGEFVLTRTVELSDGMMTRLAKPMHASLFLNCTDPAAVFSIKALYFFPTKSSADSFTVVQDMSEVMLNGSDISEYRIVVSEDAGDQTYIAVNQLAARIKTLIGTQLAIVTDDTAPTAKEIIIGNTNRAVSKTLEASFTAYDQYAAAVDGMSLAINAYLPANLSEAVNDYMRNFLYLGLKNPEKIVLDNTSVLTGTTDKMVYYGEWNAPANVTNPVVYTEDFDSDDGYWTEEANTSDWSYSGGVYTTNTDDFALSYVHVYETNVKYGAKMMYTTAGSDAEMGLMLRYTGEDAYVKAGYDFENGEWYIESREGNDFNLIRSASAKAALTPNTWYDLVFTIDGTVATLSVNGAALLSANVTQTSPGRVAVYADNANVSMDDSDITLLSGEGTILKNLTHLKIDVDSYTEGGSAWELSDGTVLFEHKNLAYKSLDKGYTWEKTEKQMGIIGYPTILRLNDGSLLSAGDNEGNKKIARISYDDGKTWTTQGIICNRYWQLDGKDTTAGAGNMNDKLFQSATTGRIFYGQNYESQQGPVEGRVVFCEFYYSDDNGKTWTKADTDSWELPGNEGQTHFGECKMLECADGTIRMYNSWNQHGNIMYSESYDNGVTWGPLTPLEGFNCTQSSMQFVRDPYAENDTTYYMVWINNVPVKGYASSAPRARLTLAKSTDGKNWTVMGDIWRWEGNYLAPDTKALINQIVDPFVQVTEDTIIVGSGISEQIGLAMASDNGYHQAQREHLWTLDKEINDPGENLGSFIDVTTKDSYYEAVKFVTEKGLFNGTSAVTFSPDTTMTRSMFVTVLGRLDGADVSKYTTPTFADVVAGQWYTSYVEWAAANGVVNGIGNGLYGINDNVTVEQVCVMLSRYNGAKTAAASGKTLADFADSASVSTWAADAVKWAVENGVYAGNGGMLDPTAPASRSLVATMFYNYVNVYEK